MRGILLLCWLSFLATSLSMLQHNDCNFTEQVIQSSQDFRICVCLNQVYVNCTLNGANVATKNLSMKEEICYKRLVKLANTSNEKTCVCSKHKQCHSQEQVALHQATCARKAVMKMNPILSYFKTLCCDLQNALLKLWLKLEEEVFLLLIKSVNHDSLDTRTLSRRLRRTNWCKAFRPECLKVDSFIRKGCKVRTNFHKRHKRNIDKTHRNYETEFVPFSTATTKRLQIYTKQSTIQSSTEEMTTTRTQTTRVPEVFPTSTWPARLIRTVYRLRSPPLSSPSSSSSPPLSSVSSSVLLSLPASSSSSSSSGKKSSPGLLSSTSSSSSPSHLTQNQKPSHSFVEPSTTRELSNTAELQTALLSNAAMTTLFRDQITKLMVERSPSVAISSSLSVESSITLSMSKAQLDDSSSLWYSSSSSLSSSLRIKSFPLPSRTSPFLSMSFSSSSPTPRHWSLGVSKSRNETSIAQRISSSELTAESVSTAVSIKGPSFPKYSGNKTYDMTPVKQTSARSVSKTKALTPSMVDYETSESSHVKTLTSELHHIIPTPVSTREFSLVDLTVDRQMSDNKMETSVRLLATSTLASRSTLLQDVDIRSRYESRITRSKRKSWAILATKTGSVPKFTSFPSSSITAAPTSVESDKIKSNHALSHMTESMIFHESKASIGSSSTRATKTYEYSSVNGARSLSIRVIKPTPRLTLTSTRLTTGLHTIPVSSLDALRESAAENGSSSPRQSTTLTLLLSSLPKSSSSLSTTPLLTEPALPKTRSLQLSSGLAYTVILSSSSPSLSITASGSQARPSSETFTEQEMSILRFKTSSLSAMSVFASSSIQPSKSQITISTSLLSATSTSSTSTDLSATKILPSLVPSPPQTTSLFSSSVTSSSSPFQKIFIPNQLSSAVSSRSLVSPASTVLPEDTSFMYSIVHISSSPTLNKPPISTSVAPTMTSRTPSLSSSTTSLNYSVFAKNSDIISSITTLSHSSAISAHWTTSLTEYSYLDRSSHYSSISSLNQTMPAKLPVLLPVTSPSSSPSLSPPPSPPSSQPLSSSSTSSLPSTQPLSQPLSSPSLLPSWSPPTSQPLSSLLSSTSLSSSNASFGWQLMLRVTTPVSKGSPLSTQNETTQSLVQNQSTIALKHPIPPLSLAASFAPSSTSPSPLLPSLLVKSLLSTPSVSASLRMTSSSQTLMSSMLSSTSVSSLTLLSSKMSSATSIFVFLSSSQLSMSLTPVLSLRMPTSSLSSTPSLSSSSIISPSSASFLMFTPSPLSLSLTSPASSLMMASPTSTLSLSPSLMLSSSFPSTSLSVSPSLMPSTPPLSTSLMASASLLSTSSVPFSLSSSLLATPSLSSGSIPSSLLIISSSYVPSSFQLSMSPTLLAVSSSSSSVSSMSSSSLPQGSSVSLSLNFSLSSTTSIAESTTSVQLPKKDTVANSILPSKTFFVQQTSTPVPSKGPLIKEIFLAVFDSECLDVTTRQSFKTAFIDTLIHLIGIDNDVIDILDIRCGSVEVLFSIIHKPSDNITEVFDRLVKEKRFNIVFKGKTYIALSITSLRPTATRPATISPSFINPPINVLTAQINERRLVKILFVLFVSIFIALALFGVVICIARICGRRRYARLRLKSSTLSSRGTNQIYKNELELIRMSPLHRYADYYGGTNQEAPKEESDDDDNVNNRTALLNMLRNGEIASRRGKIMIKDDDSYSSIAFY